MKRALYNNRGTIALSALAIAAVIVGTVGAVVWWANFHDSEDPTVADTTEMRGTTEVDELPAQLELVQEALTLPVDECQAVLEGSAAEDQVNCEDDEIVLDEDAKPLINDEICDNGILVQGADGEVRCMYQMDDDLILNQETLDKNQVDELIPIDDGAGGI